MFTFPNDENLEAEVKRSPESRRAKRSHVHFRLVPSLSWRANFNLLWMTSEWAFFAYDSNNSAAPLKNPNSNSIILRLMARSLSSVSVRVAAI